MGNALCPVGAPVIQNAMDRRATDGETIRENSMTNDGKKIENLKMSGGMMIENLKTENSKMNDGTKTRNLKTGNLKDLKISSCCWLND